MNERDYHYTGYNSDLLNQSRELRKQMTRHERHLWYDFLKTYPVRCNRQRSIDRYIVDFYISSARLIIELDGSQHYTKDGMIYDRIRTDVLEKYGLTVLRFTNDQIDHEFERVCEVIDAAVREKTVSDKNAVAAVRC